MKLVRIKDVRENQVWISDNDERKYLVVEDKDNNDYLFFDKFFNYSVTEHSIYNIDEYKLIGFIGITHKVDDDKLVEIEREAIYYVDDVLEFGYFDKNSTKIGVLTSRIDNYREDDDEFFFVYEITDGKEYYNFNSFEIDIQKIGTLGVTHEFK
jgi:hypothetical protein